METNAQENDYNVSKSVFQSLKDSLTLFLKANYEFICHFDNIVHNHRLSIQVFDVPNTTM